MHIFSAHTAILVALFVFSAEHAMAKPRSDTTPEAKAKPSPLVIPKLPRIGENTSLPHMSAIRWRDRHWDRVHQAIRKTHTVISTRPTGAKIFHRRKYLGRTPLTVSATQRSSAIDISIVYPDRMRLRTRITRDRNRRYHYNLTPTK